MIKKILLTLFSLFLAYRSIELVRFINSYPPYEYSWLGILAVAVGLNLFITGVFALLGFAWTTNSVLPNAYYQIKDAPRLKYFCKISGVKYFRSFLLVTFWGKEKNRKRYFDGTKSNIEHFDTQTRQSEFGHLAALLAVFVASCIVLWQGHVVLFLLTTFINIIFNLYPVLLQRMHRIQIERVVSLMQKRRELV